MACRSEDKAAAAINDLKRNTKSDKIYFLKLDLADLASIKATVAEFLRLARNTVSARWGKRLTCLHGLAAKSRP